eukprot:scaffold3.g6535.t1
MGFPGVNPPDHPSGYDPDNKFADPVLYFQHREAAVADEFVKVAEAKNLRRKLKLCYKNAGVNYQQDCRELALAYLESIKGVGVYRANSGPNDQPRWGQFKPQ